MLPDIINDHFDDAGEKRCDGCTFDTESREAAFTEDENIVEADIYDQREQGNDETDIHRLDAAQGGDHDGGNGVEEVGKGDDGEIAGTFFDDSGLIGKQGEDAGGENQAGKPEQGREEQRDDHTDLADTVDGLDFTASPTAGGENRDTFGTADDEHLQEELELVDQRDTGHGGFAVGTEHDVVGKIDAVDHEIL